MADEKYLDAMEIEVDDSGTKETWPLKDSYALRANQGTENAGKILTVGSDGIVTPVDMDETLTDNTKAAPAGVVGELKSDLSEIEEVTVKLENKREVTDITSKLNFSDGFVNTTGYTDATNTTYKRTEKMLVNEGDIYSTNSKYTPYRYICAYNGESVVSDKGADSAYSYTVPSGVTHIVISIYATESTETGTVIQDTEIIKRSNINDDAIAEIDKNVENIKSATVLEKTYVASDNITKSLVFSDGFVRSDGTFGESTSYKYAEIEVKEGDVFHPAYSESQYRFVCAYSDGVVQTDKGADSVYSYTVPSGIDKVAITCYVNTMAKNDIIIRDRSKKEYVNSANVIEPKHTLREPRITFIDDDGYAEFYQYFVPIMRKYNVPMCSAYMGDMSPTMSNSSYMTKEQCDEIIALGGEILVHGGRSLTSFDTVEEAEANVLLSKNNLRHMGFDSDIYVYPNGGNNIAIREMIAKHFKCAFKTGYPQKYDARCNDKCVPSYFIHRSSWGGYYDDKSTPYDSIETHTIEYFKALIDECVANNSWLVVMTHAWQMPVGCDWRTDPEYTYNNMDEFALIEQAIEYVQQLQASGSNVKIVNASEGYEMFKNAYESGDYLGYWNEIYTSDDMPSYWHDKGGFAVNKLGEVDFPIGNKIQH